MLRRLSYNSLILLLSNGSTAVLAFVLTLIIARGLGDAALGQYAAVMAWVLPLTLLVDAGISSLITRDVAQNPALASSYLQSTYRVRLGVGLSVIGLIWLLAPYLTPDANIASGLRIAIWLVLIDTLFANYTAVFRALDEMLPILMLNSGLLILQVIGALLVVEFGADIQWLFAAVVVADVIQLGATWLVWRHIQRRVAQSSTALDWRPLLGRGLSFMIAGVLATLQMRGIVLLLQYYEPSQAVGWFAAASRMIEALRMFPQAMFAALFPALSALIEVPTEMRRVFRLALLLVISYGLLITAGFLAVGESVIWLVFGDAFQPANRVGWILGLALLFGLVRGLLTLWYYALHRERLVNWLLLAALGVQLAAGVILIPQVGFEAAGWALLIGEIVVVSLMIIRRPKVLL